MNTLLSFIFVDTSTSFIPVPFREVAGAINNPLVRNLLELPEGESFTDSMSESSQSEESEEDIEEHGL